MALHDILCRIEDRLLEIRRLLEQDPTRRCDTSRRRVWPR
jgi:hypothetical protein